MPPVPGVKGRDQIQPNKPEFRVFEPAGEVLRSHGAEQGYPPKVNAFKDLQGWLDRRRSRIGEFRPRLLVVTFDGRLVLGESQAQAHKTLHVTLGDVVDSL